jgi:hypothetical protein
MMRKLDRMIDWVLDWFCSIFLVYLVVRILRGLW